MSSSVRASVVIVAFGSEDVVEGAIRSVPDDFEVVVVEQSADSASALVALQARHPRTKIVHAGANRGFGAGCNLGAAQAVSDVVIFLNPDARAIGDSLEVLAANVRESGGTAVCGPLIRAEDGESATRARRWTNPVQDFAVWARGLHGVPRSWMTEIHEDDPVYRDGGEVGFVQGACLAIDRSTFFKAGGFDERLFLYGEEESLAVELSRAGVTHRIVANAAITHAGQTSTARLSHFSMRQKFRSRVLVFKNRYGAFRGTVFGFAFLIGAIAMWAGASARQTLRPGSNDVAGWMFRDVVGGLVDGLLSRPVAPPQQLSTNPWSTESEPGSGAS